MKIVTVAAIALIDPDRRILMAQRPEGKALAGLWEFPGGKLEAGETPEVALIREMQEELGLDICHSCLSAGPFVSYSYTHQPPADEPGCGCPVDTSHFVSAQSLGLQEEFHLVMMLFLCRKWKGTPYPKENQKLAWYKLGDIARLPMPPADVPLIRALQDML